MLVVTATINNFIPTLSGVDNEARYTLLNRLGQEK